MYKEASKLGLRIQAKQGLLSVEQLWNLPLKELDSIAVALQEAQEKAGKKSFLVTKSQEDEIAQLKFKIVYDILETKVKESEALKTAKENKAHNQRILNLINDKKEESLKSLSIEELEKELR